MDWVTIVSSLGFPIAMCAALCWFINKKDEQNTKTIVEVTAAIRELSADVKELLRKE